jgi:hypothetical protein
VATLIRAILVLLTGATAGNLSAGQTPPSTQGGARIDAPFQRQVSGAQCYSGTGEHAGNVAFGFPQRAGRGPHPVALTFTLGPLRDGNSPGQENNAPYTGPGDYKNIGIVVQPESGEPVFGHGTIHVNADEQTGTFKLPGGASGMWDCGQKLRR